MAGRINVSLIPRLHSCDISKTKGAKQIPGVTPRKLLELPRAWQPSTFSRVMYANVQASPRVDLHLAPAPHRVSVRHCISLLVFWIPMKYILASIV